MNLLGKVWLTPFPTESGKDTGMFTLSLQSRFPEEVYKRLHADEMLFPFEPTPKHPLKHVITIQLLDQEDINLLAQTLDAYRDDRNIPDEDK